MVLDEIIQQFKDDTADGEKIVAHLITRTIAGPRGLLKLDPETLFYIAPVARYSLKAGTLIPETFIISDLEKEWRSFTAKPTEGAVTGWINTYLCY